MKLFGSRCEIIFILFVSVYLHLTEATDRVDEYKRCYNTSTEMHCFDVQYDNRNWLTASFDNAQRRCSERNSTLIIINDDDTNELMERFMKDPDNIIRFKDVWLDAYRVSDYNNSYTWHWVDTTLPNIPESGVADISDPKWSVVALEFKDNSFRLRAQQPHLTNSYVCEYPKSNCSSINSNNARQINGRCYIVTNASVDWYEARNRCLKDGGDLASFANVASINFTSWLVANPDIRYWIGLRFTWYIWKDTGKDVRYAKWMKTDNGWDSYCLIVEQNYNYQTFSWFPTDCNSGSPYVVCHKVTPLIPTTTSTISTPTSTAPTTIITVTSVQTSSSISQNNSSVPFTVSSGNTAIGVGVGVGIGVPVVIAIIVIIIFIIRKRQHGTTFSMQSTTHQHELPSGDLPNGPNGPEEKKNKDNVGEVHYGIILPSTLSRRAAEATADSSTKGQTEYAPLQFL